MPLTSAVRASSASGTSQPATLTNGLKCIVREHKSHSRGGKPLSGRQSHSATTEAVSGSTDDGSQWQSVAVSATTEAVSGTTQDGAADGVLVEIVGGRIK